MVSDEPTRDGKAARITTGIPIRTATRRSAAGTAVLQPRHHRVADRRGRADRDQKSRHCAGHRPLPACAIGPIVHRTIGPVVARIGRQIWRPRSLIIQAKCGILAEQSAFSALPFGRLGVVEIGFVRSASWKGNAMRKTLAALAAVATMAVSAIAAPAPAHAQRGVGVGIAAGLLGGAIVGGAIASGNGYYGPGYYGYGPRYYGPGYGYYGGGPAYVADDYYGGCVWQRQRFWDGYGWRVRRVRVCG